MPTKQRCTETEKNEDPLNRIEIRYHKIFQSDKIQYIHKDILKNNMHFKDILRRY